MRIDIAYGNAINTLCKDRYFTIKYYVIINIINKHLKSKCFFSLQALVDFKKYFIKQAIQLAYEFDIDDSSMR